MITSRPPPLPLPWDTSPIELLFPNLDTEEEVEEDKDDELYVPCDTAPVCYGKRRKRQRDGKRKVRFDLGEKRDAEEILREQRENQRAYSRTYKVRKAREAERRRITRGSQLQDLVLRVEAIERWIQQHKK